MISFRKEKEVMSEQFYDMIDGLVSQRISSTPIDTTITASINQVRNVEVGEYRVSYKGDTFLAYSMDPMTVYKTGESVFVLVPQGDFSARKVILGKAALNDKVSFADRQAMQNQWRTRGPNWLSAEWYWRTSAGARRGDARDAEIISTTRGEEGLISAPPTGSPQARWMEYVFAANDSRNPTVPPLAADLPQPNADRVANTLYPTGINRPGAAVLDRVDELFQVYSNTYEYIMIKAKFRTEFVMTHFTGSYGLLVECWSENPDYGVSTAPTNTQPRLLKQYRFPSIEFNGTPLQLPFDTPQQIVFRVPKGTLKGLVRVALYQDGEMLTDISPIYDESTDPITQIWDPAMGAIVNRNRDNIFASDIDIRWCEKISLTDTLFWLDIQTPDGVEVFNSLPNMSASPRVRLEAKLYYGSEDITSPDTCKFIWFRRKYSATMAQVDQGNPHASPPDMGDMDEYGRSWHDYGGNGWAPVEKIMKNPAGVTTGDFAFLGQDAFFGEGNGTFIAPKYQLEDPQNLWISSGGQNGFLPAYTPNLIVGVDAVPWQWEYKCVCIYNPTASNLEERLARDSREVILWKEELIYRYDSPFDFSLDEVYFSDDNKIQFLRLNDLNNPWVRGEVGNPAIRDIEITSTGQIISDNLLNKDWWCRWWFETPAGRYEPIPNTGTPRFLKGRRPVNDYLGNDIVTFKAQIYGNKDLTDSKTQASWSTLPPPPSDAGEYSQYELGNIELTVYREGSPRLMIDWVGITHHSYNSDGSISFAARAGQEYSLQAICHWMDRNVGEYSLEWFAPDGEPLRPRQPTEENGTGYSPPDSMLKDMWVGHDNIVRYKVAQKYDLTKTGSDHLGRNKNVIILKVRIIGLEDETFDYPKEITFSKDGQQGTQGSDWEAQIWPTNETDAPAIQGVNFPKWTEPIKLFPRPLVVNGSLNQTGDCGENPNFKLFLRPFVYKNGVPIEELGSADGYSYKVYWDTRLPTVKNDGLSGRKAASNSGFLDLQQIAESSYSNGHLGGKPAGTTVPSNPQRFITEPGPAYFQAYTDWNITPGVDNLFGAIRVRWRGRGRVGAYEQGGSSSGWGTMKDVNYSFIVKAQVDIFQHGTLIATIYSYWPVDIIFTQGSTLGLTPAKLNQLNLNWPQFVLYTSVGIAPQTNQDYLRFFYGQNAFREHQPRPITAIPINLTPNIQDISLHSTQDPYSWRLRPRTFYFFENADNGAIAAAIGSAGTLPGDGASITYPGGHPQPNNDFSADWGNSIFVRPVVHMINQFGNSSINGWDGKSIDINEENGTIFAPTVGAGYKDPFTNTFSGVIMGIDSSQLKEHYADFYGGSSDEDIKRNPYMTGLYGYQAGVISFGIMENGTAFFGRADRGGRIIIDGFNAQIYGGSGIETKTGLEADMRNRMRLSFIDFGGVQNQMDLDAAALELNTTAFNTLAKAMADYVATINWRNYERNPSYRQVVEDYLANMRAQMALIPNAPTPGPNVGNGGSIALGSFVIDQNQNPASTFRDQWFGNFRAYFAPGAGAVENPYALRYGGYFSSTSFSTPAIEIGSYEDWVRTANGARRPYTAGEMAFVRDGGQYHRGKDLIRHYTIAHIQDQARFNNISDLEIPGYRRFLVTYDGTLYAMNAFIKGNIIGSNIIGSQYFNAEGSFVVTEDGNLGIGKGNGDWTEWVVNNGYSSLWSANVPTRSPRPVSFWLDTIRNQRRDFIDGGFAFYVSYDGTVICKDIHIAGGSLNIGNFHIIGVNDSDGWVYGDVVSYGTMYLIGRQPDGNNTILGTNTAVQAWGDFYLRGKLVNLGPIFLGSSMEKLILPGEVNNINPVQRATSFNSPISILPTATPGSSQTWAGFDIKMGLWPLYCFIGDYTNSNRNNTWITLSGNGAATTAPTDSTNNGYMPIFSWRPTTERNFTGTGDDELIANVTWRLDQIGMWSDAIIFTRKSWVPGNFVDTEPASLQTHGLSYFGWMQHTGETGNRRWSFTIKNVSAPAPDFVIQTVNSFKLVAGDRWNGYRGSPAATLPPQTFVSLFALQTNAAVPLTHASTLYLSEGNLAAHSKAILTSGAISIVSRTFTNPDNTNPDDMRAFLFLSNIHATGAPIQDELGNEILMGGTPSEGRVWFKAASMALDTSGITGTTPNPVNNSNMATADGNTASLRLNRGPGGEVDPGITAGGNVPWRNLAYLGGTNIVLQGRAGGAARLVVHQITPENQYGIYARFG